MAQPELGGGEFEHGEEVCGVLLIPGGEAQEVLDAIEEALDAIARPIAISSWSGRRSAGRQLAFHKSRERASFGARLSPGWKHRPKFARWQ
jgi:hypothetical protein